MVAAAWLNGTGPQSWVMLALGLSMLMSRNNFQSSVLHLPSTGTEAEAGSMEGSQCQARAATGAKEAVIGAFRKSQLRWLSCLVTFYLFIYYSEGLFTIPSVSL